MELFQIIFISYLMGSMPFGFLLTKLFLKIDIREIGSGNIGATNVLRTGNKLIGYGTLILDIVKAVIPVLISKFYFEEYIYISALAVFIGHVFPVWLKFKGGKGVATYLGVLIALSYTLSILFIFTWIVVLLIFRFSSLSSMFASLTVCVINFFRENAIQAIDPNFDFGTDIKLLLFVFFILMIFTHKKNISNLKNKTEIKIKN